jgi:hypothetical protein
MPSPILWEDEFSFIVPEEISMRYDQMFFAYRICTARFL